MALVRARGCSAVFEVRHRRTTPARETRETLAGYKSTAVEAVCVRRSTWQAHANVDLLFEVAMLDDQARTRRASTGPRQCTSAEGFAGGPAEGWRYCDSICWRNRVANSMSASLANVGVGSPLGAGWWGGWNMTVLMHIACPQEIARRNRTFSGPTRATLDCGCKQSRQHGRPRLLVG